MLGILICYATLHEFEPLQVRNLRRFVKCPHKIYIIHSGLSPKGASAGHMENLNALLDRAWDECDSFLFFDNDMIMLNDFTEPEEDCWYYPQQREGYEYAWTNLIYFKKHPLMRRINFATEFYGDGGGSTWKYLKEISNKKTMTPDQEGMEEYQEEMKVVVEKYGIGAWSERYMLDKTSIFHFRAMSNWTNYPAGYVEEKTKLIFKHAPTYC